MFTHPLPAILDPALSEKEPLSEKGGEDWLYEAEYYVSIVDGFHESYRYSR